MKTKQPLVVIGGMGPQASAEVHARLVSMAKAKVMSDNTQDFPEIIVLSLPVPDFIADMGSIEAAFAMIVSEGQKATAFDPLITMMACNTAHLLFERLDTKLPELHLRSLIDAVVQRAVSNEVQTIGLLASPITIHTKLYQKTFEAAGIRCVLPQESELPVLEQIIRGVIAEDSNKTSKQQLNTMAHDMLSSGCDAVLLGCTELPIAFGAHNDSRILDCIQVLCETMLEEHSKN